MNKIKLSIRCGKCQVGGVVNERNGSTSVCRSICGNGKDVTSAKYILSVVSALCVKCHRNDVSSAT